MNQKQEMRFEIKMAMMRLNRIKNSGDDAKYIEAANSILEDKKLLLRYVKNCIERKNAKKIKKSLTSWQKFARVFKPKA